MLRLIWLALAQLAARSRQPPQPSAVPADYSAAFARFLVSRMRCRAVRLRQQPELPRRLQRVGDVQEVAKHLREILERMHGRVRADEAVLPVAGRLRIE